MVVRVVPRTDADLARRAFSIAAPSISNSLLAEVNAITVLHSNDI